MLTQAQETLVLGLPQDLRPIFHTRYQEYVGWWQTTHFDDLRGLWAPKVGGNPKPNLFLRDPPGHS